MRLRRLELAVIALTLAFGCFIGGYFTGLRGAVNILTVAPQNGEMQIIGAGTSSFPAREELLPAAVPAGEGSAAGAGTSGVDPGSNGGAVPDGPAPENQAAEKQAPDNSVAPASVNGVININLASQSELMDLPGIGSVLAGRIVDYRQQHGPFSRIEDLRSVSGIGEKRFSAIQDKISVG